MSGEDPEQCRCLFLSTVPRTTQVRDLVLSHSLWLDQWKELLGHLDPMQLHEVPTQGR